MSAHRLFASSCAVAALIAAPRVGAQQSVRSGVDANTSQGVVPLNWTPRCQFSETESPAPLACHDKHPSLGFTREAQERRRTPVWSVLASAAVPGLGQALLGEERSIIYAALEVYALAQYSAHTQEARRYRNAYTNLAARVARAPFAREAPNGNFEYYERLEHFVESGAFDVSPDEILDPETDTTTFNGSIWLLARRTYWKDVHTPPSRESNEWKLAQQLYERRAYRDRFRWSWRNAQLEYDQFRRLIKGSNDANRKSLQDIGLIIANHALSTVDAYITIRLRRRQDAAVAGYEVRAQLPIGIR